MITVLKKPRTLVAVIGLTAVATVMWLAVSPTDRPLAFQYGDRLSATSDASTALVSYDKSTPPGTGCEDVVGRLQQLVFAGYADVLHGVRYANMWGYLETPNKGDAAIWIAQQLVLATLGIETMEVCRILDKCDLRLYRQRLAEKQPHSAIIMAGGGNFNDFYWKDHPMRLRVAERFHEVPIRMFPQSIYMRVENRIKDTYDSFRGHPNVQLGARDQPSYDWLKETFGPNEKNGPNGTGVNYTLTPDVVFAYGNRPEYRTKEPKQYDLYIMARNDRESSTLYAKSPKEAEGTIQLGQHKVTYLKQDWNKMPTPDLDDDETGFNQRAFLKAEEGFRILGRAEMVITDRLHGHIMSTVIGVPHILMDSKLGKNLALHDTWTSDCDCVRIADDWSESMDYAEMWFDKAYREGRWRPSVE